jgi:FlaA1/EpsC-like NDP-sugar epimerase
MIKINSQFITLVLALPRWVKRTLVITLDLNLCLISVWLAYYLRLGEFIGFTGSSQWSKGATLAAAVSIGFALPIFVVSGLYRSIFRHFGWSNLLVLARTVGAYGLVYAMIFTFLSRENVPRTVGIIQPVLLLLFMSASRYFVQPLLGNHSLHLLKDSSRPKALIYGAGHSGQQLKSALDNNSPLQVVGFLDDDDRLYGNVLNGSPIYNPADLPNLVLSQKVSDVLLAMPNLSSHRRIEILNRLRVSPVSIRSMPNISKLAQGKVGISDSTESDIDYLLGRESVIPDRILMTTNVHDKVIMVTGAGGSIGGEICRQILLLGPNKLLLIENNELALYSILYELEEKLASIKTVKAPILVPLLTSVQDKEQINAIISGWRPDTIYHAAAYKHVSLVEENMVAGIKNNVFGTLNMAKAAINNGVHNFVLISTDKAVRPTSVMGATKRLAEMALQAIAVNTIGTKFSMVRFGNVLGSSGSVVPKFKQQIREGGPITITHPEVTRFFMTITEASQLVIQAGALAKSGDLFVLDMGHPVKIIDLAKRLVEFFGLKLKDEEYPHGDIEIKIIGLQPGEKLHEELFIGESTQSTIHPRILKANETFMDWSELAPWLSALEFALKMNDVVNMRQILQALVKDYNYF